MEKYIFKTARDGTGVTHICKSSKPHETLCGVSTKGMIVTKMAGLMTCQICLNKVKGKTGLWVTK